MEKNDGVKKDNLLKYFSENERMDRMKEILHASMSVLGVIFGTEQI